MLTDPDSALPDCASTHENVSGPSPSDPLPVHAPVRFSDVAAGVDLRIGRWRVRPTWRIRENALNARVTTTF